LRLRAESSPAAFKQRGLVGSGKNTCPTPAAYALPVEGTPILLLDVDGVLNPYPTCPPGFAEYALFPNDDEPVRLAAVHGSWLHELGRCFKLVWATSWGSEANRLLCPLFELPELPVIAFPEAPFDPAAKTPAIDAFVGNQPVAWVDDVITPEARLWAAGRKAPTLLVDVDPAAGLTRPAVDRMLEWVRTHERPIG
jgi:hypothetical protein